jgi:LEA14-like dessication related protein
MRLQSVEWYKQLMLVVMIYIYIGEINDREAEIASFFKVYNNNLV